MGIKVNCLLFLEVFSQPQERKMRSRGEENQNAIFGHLGLSGRRNGKCHGEWKTANPGKWRLLRVGGQRILIPLGHGDHWR